MQAEQQDRQKKASLDHFTFEFMKIGFAVARAIFFFMPARCGGRDEQRISF